MKQNIFDLSQTKINLARAFAGECQDGARYQFIATLAEDEGYFYLQTILKTLAKNEMAHAKTFFNLICANCSTPQKNIDISAGYPFSSGSLKECLCDSIDVESSQADNIYPAFAKIAEDEGFETIAKKFEFCATVENCHKLLLTQLCEKIKNHTLYKSNNIVKWKCGNCGFEHSAKTPWDNCPSCNAPQGYVQIQLDVGKN